MLEVLQLILLCTHIQIQFILDLFTETSIDPIEMLATY